MPCINNVPDTNEEPLVIGAITPSANFFTGAIDEVGIFNVALSEADIHKIKDKGLSEALYVSDFGKLVSTWSAIKLRN